MITQFPLTVMYTQVVVHEPDLPRPGLLWTDDHVDQGFAWSRGIASFGVPDHDGACLLRVDAGSGFALDPRALWAVQVPFDVATPTLKIGTIADMRDVAVPPGSYALVFQALPGEAAEGGQTYVLDLFFAETDAADFAILKQGDELLTDEVLRRDAEHG